MRPPTSGAPELALRDNLVETRAAVDARDDELNEIADQVSSITLFLTRNDRTHPLYTLFFGNKTLSEFKHPILAKQLEAMRGWIPSLKASKHAALQALAPELEAKIKAADAAVALRKELTVSLKQLRSDGDLHALIEKTNATRMSVFGALGKLTHEHVGLPSNFANRFFLRDSKDAGDEPVTIDSVNAAIASLEEELAAQKELLEELKAQEATKAAQAKADAEAAAAKAKLAELERIMADAAQQAAALKAQIAPTA